MSSIRNKSGYLMGVMKRFQISGERGKKRNEERGEMDGAEAGDEHTHDEHTDDTVTTRHCSDMKRQKTKASSFSDSLCYWKDSSVFYKIAGRATSESQSDGACFCQICFGPCRQGHAQYPACQTVDKSRTKTGTGGRRLGDPNTRWAEDLRIIQVTFDHIAEVIPGVTSMSSVGTLSIDALKWPGPRKSIHSFMRISKLRRGLIMEMLCAQRPDLHEKINPLMLELETLYQAYEAKKKAASRLTTGRN